MKSALILVDIQNDYFKGGRSELNHHEEAAKNAKTLLNFFREHNLSVYHVQHINTNSKASFFLSGSTGAKIHTLVTPNEDEKIFIKHTPNSFYNTGLAEVLFNSGIKHIVVCGMMTHMCIDTTVRAAKDLGFSVTLIEDACTTKNLIWNEQIIPAEVVHVSYMASLNGMFAEITTAAKFLEGADTNG
ncbi:MAG: nicotinamidase-like amidase [Clostridiales bacterium]|nr:nicotinamidase-like amidase [Clostridiales bacterium]